MLRTALEHTDAFWHIEELPAGQKAELELERAEALQKLAEEFNVSEDQFQTGVLTARKAFWRQKHPENPERLTKEQELLHKFMSYGNQKRTLSRRAGFYAKADKNPDPMMPSTSRASNVPNVVAQQAKKHKTSFFALSGDRYTCGLLETEHSYGQTVVGGTASNVLVEGPQEAAIAETEPETESVVYEEIINAEPQGLPAIAETEPEAGSINFTIEAFIAACDAFSPEDKLAFILGVIERGEESWKVAVVEAIAGLLQDK